MRFAILLSLAIAALAVPTKRDASAVKADIVTIVADANSLDNLVKGYTGGNLVIANKIATGTLALANSFKQATEDTTAAAAFTQSDADTFATSISNIKSSISNVVNDLVAKKAALGPISGFLFQYLTSLDENSKTFLKALIAKAAANSNALTISPDFSATVNVGVSAFSSS
ncbi:hydrophobic surface binding protein A-domain-containing protein [Mycena floridula]|nr:hydrophobic surface binding protein A-domain-containing protein [Mycena floridula]